MKARTIYICSFVILVLVLGAFFYLNSAKAKCPDDYPDTDEGSKAYLADTDRWTNAFYDSHPSATLGEWAQARLQFLKDNDCSEALLRYEQVKNL